MMKTSAAHSILAEAGLIQPNRHSSAKKTDRMLRRKDELKPNIKEKSVLNRTTVSFRDFVHTVRNEEELQESSVDMRKERNLLIEPMCNEEDLGKAIPPTPYGVSVCLPLWQHVIGYEENDPRIVGKFESGYPRFFMPKAIERLINKLEKENAKENERLLAFPRIEHAKRCCEFITRKAQEKSLPTPETRVFEWGKLKIGICIFPKSHYDNARLFWRLSGEIISSRQAEFILSYPDNPHPLKKQGRHACALIKKKLAKLTHQNEEDIFLFPSGMAASFAVHRMLTHIRPDCKTVQLDFPYVDLLKIQENFGKGVHFLSAEQGDADDKVYNDLQKLIAEEELGGLFLETPSNPLLKCLDVERILQIREDAQKTDQLPVILDDTVTSCLSAQAFKYADLVVTSLTKAFSGKGDVLAGCIILKNGSPQRDKFYQFLRDHSENELWIDDAIALERNSRDFTERKEASGRNGEALYDLLVSHKAVEKVFYPKCDLRKTFLHSLSSNPEKGGYGALLSFTLKNPERTSEPFYNSLRVSKGPSLGTNFTLVCPYTLLAHYHELEWAEKRGVSRWLIRVSVGLEETQELLKRFRDALDAIQVE